MLVLALPAASSSARGPPPPPSSLLPETPSQVNSWRDSPRPIAEVADLHAPHISPHTQLASSSANASVVGKILGRIFGRTDPDAGKETMSTDTPLPSQQDWTGEITRSATGATRKINRRIFDGRAPPEEPPPEPERPAARPEEPPENCAALARHTNLGARTPPESCGNLTTSKFGPRHKPLCSNYFVVHQNQPTHLYPCVEDDSNPPTPCKLGSLRICPVPPPAPPSPPPPPPPPSVTGWVYLGCFENDDFSDALFTKTPYATGDAAGSAVDRCRTTCAAMFAVHFALQGTPATCACGGIGTDSIGGMAADIEDDGPKFSDPRSALSQARRLSKRPDAECPLNRRYGQSCHDVPDINSPGCRRDVCGTCGGPRARSVYRIEGKTGVPPSPPPAPSPPSPPLAPPPSPPYEGCVNVRDDLCGRLAANDELMAGEYIINTEGERLCLTDRAVIYYDAAGAHAQDLAFKSVRGIRFFDDGRLCVLSEVTPQPTPKVDRASAVQEEERPEAAAAPYRRPPYTGTSLDPPYDGLPLHQTSATAAVASRVTAALDAGSSETLAFRTAAAASEFVWCSDSHPLTFLKRFLSGPCMDDAKYVRRNACSAIATCSPPPSPPRLPPLPPAPFPYPEVPQKYKYNFTTVGEDVGMCHGPGQYACCQWEYEPQPEDCFAACQSHPECNFISMNHSGFCSLSRACDISAATFWKTSDGFPLHGAIGPYAHSSMQLFEQEALNSTGTLAPAPTIRPNPMRIFKKTDGERPNDAWTPPLCVPKTLSGIPAGQEDVCHETLEKIKRYCELQKTFGPNGDLDLKHFRCSTAQCQDPDLCKDILTELRTPPISGPCHPPCACLPVCPNAPPPPPACPALDARACDGTLKRLKNLCYTSPPSELALLTPDATHWGGVRVALPVGYDVVCAGLGKRDNVGPFCGIGATQRCQKRPLRLPGVVQRGSELTHENCRRLLGLIAREHRMLCTWFDEKPCDCPCLPQTLGQPDTMNADGTVAPHVDPTKSTTTDPCLQRLNALTGSAITDWPDDCPPSPPPLRHDVTEAASLRLAAAVMGSGMALLPT